jgi:hypothetical protein
VSDELSRAGAARALLAGFGIVAASFALSMGAGGLVLEAEGPVAALWACWTAACAFGFFAQPRIRGAVSS